jgi:hypothetical protein
LLVSKKNRHSARAKCGHHPLKSDPGAQGIRNDWISALLVAFQLVMLVLLLTGQIR